MASTLSSSPTSHALLLLGLPLDIDNRFLDPRPGASPRSASRAPSRDSTPPSLPPPISLEVDGGSLVSATTLLVLVLPRFGRGLEAAEASVVDDARVLAGVLLRVVREERGTVALLPSVSFKEATSRDPRDEPLPTDSLRFLMLGGVSTLTAVRFILSLSATADVLSWFTE